MNVPIRNVAIIAHVDHGKTTLVDALLRHTHGHAFRDGESLVMDSNPIERERGITIFSKAAAFHYRGVRINVVDTPGHADFGSEVERVLRMVDGVLLLVDAVEGPMPQTKYVLRKSLELGLRPLVVVNKIDRERATPEAVSGTVFDLFCELNATEAQLDFPLIFASAKNGTATADLNRPGKDMAPLLDAVLAHVPAPAADAVRPFRMQATMLDWDPHVGLIATGRIADGTIAMKNPIVTAGGDSRGNVTRLLRAEGLQRVEIARAEAGDIIAIAGLDGVRVGDTIAAPDAPGPLPRIHIDEPTIAVHIGHNTSPLAGKDGGRFLTAPHIRERLEHEALVNVGLRVEPAPGSNMIKVSGRGELHLVVLIETMRREGYEIEVSRPTVILKRVDGRTLEPVEELVVDVDPEHQGAVIQRLGERRSKMVRMETSAVGTTRMEFHVPSRSLIGFLSEFRTLTRGTGVMYQRYLEHREAEEGPPGRTEGVMTSHTAGKVVAYALYQLQDRGEIFLRPGTALYAGMIVGVNNKGHDLIVNATREKKQSNMRAAGSDENIILTPPREITLEFALQFIDDDELVEVTPKHIRLRKKILSDTARKKAARA